MHVARAGGEAEKLFKEGVLKTVRHNTKIKNGIFQTSYPFYSTGKSNAIVKGIAIPWDNEAYDLIIERMTRGLFFHHYNKIVAKNASIQVYWFKEQSENYGFELYTDSIANATFVYHYDKVDRGEFGSVWLFDFYGSHFAGVIIISA